MLPQDPRADVGPRERGVGLGVAVGEAFIKKNALGISEREELGIGVSGDAIPDVLHELEALGDGQLGVVESRTRGPVG